MTKRDFLNALINNTISPSEAKEALEAHANFIKSVNYLKNSGFNVNVVVDLEQRFTPDILAVANALNIDKANVWTFKSENNAEYVNDHNNHNIKTVINKIKLISAFRDIFHTGLFNTKEAIETLYDEHLRKHTRIWKEFG